MTLTAPHEPMPGLASEAAVIAGFERVDQLASDVVGTLRVDALTPAGADHLMGVLVGTAKKLTGAQTLIASRAAEAGTWRGTGCRDAAEHLARRSGTTTRDAAKIIDTSKKVAALPVVADALRDGKLSGPQATEIASAAALAPQRQGELIDLAASEDLKGVRDACGRTRAANDPDPDGSHRRIHAHRKLTHWSDTEGARHGAWTMTPEASAEIEAILDAFCDKIFHQARRDGSREPLEAYRADALVAMARAAITPNPTGDDTPAPVSKEIVIRVDAQALRRGHAVDGEICEIRGIGPIPVTVAKTWLADAFLKGVLIDGVDITLVKHFGRHCPAEVRTALTEIHPACAIDGCNRSSRLELDHRNPYALGGEHSIANTQPLCALHHREKTTHDLTDIRQARSSRTGHDPP